MNKKQSISCRLITVFTSVLVISTSHAQLGEYTETVLYEGDTSPTLLGLDGGFVGRVSLRSANAYGLSLNNSGNWGGVVTMFDEGADPSTSTDDRFYSALISGSDATPNQAEVLLHAVNDDQQCALVDSSGCVDYALSSGFLNDNDVFAFLAFTSEAAGQIQGIGRFTRTNGVAAVVRTGDDGTDRYYVNSFTGFNNLGDAVGTFSAQCPPEGGSAGVIADGTSGGAVDSTTTQIPPVPTFWDRCDGSGVFYQFRSDIGLAPNSPMAFFDGLIDDGSGAQQGLYELGESGAVEFTGIEDQVYGPIAVRDNGDFVYTRNRLDTSTFESYNEIVYARDEGTGFSLTVLATEDGAGFEQIYTDSVAVNSAGVVAFVAARTLGEGNYVWAADTVNDTLVRAGGGLRFGGDIVVATDGINDRGEILASGFDGLGNVRIAKFSPPPPSEPDAGVDRGSIDFGNVLLGQSNTQTVTLSNTGTEELAVSSISIVTANTPYSIVNDSCGVALAATQSCTFDVRFVPATTGTFSGSVEVTTNDPDTPVLAIPLTGEGVQAMPNLSVPTNIDFPETDTGQSSVRMLVLENTGTDPLSVSSIVAPLAPFSISDDTCNAPTEVGAGGSCALELRFAPTVAGQFDEQIQISSNDPDAPNVFVALAGTAVDPPPPVLLGVSDSVPPADDRQVDFGNVLVQSTASETVTVSNDGEGDVSLGAMGLGEGSAPVFSVPASADECSNVTLAPTETCALEIEFSSLEAGSFSAALEIVVVDSDSINVSLAGTASLSEHDVSVSAASNVTTVQGGSGEIFELTIEVTNAGPDLARDVVASLVLPVDADVSAQPACTAGSACFTASGGGFSPDWTIGELASGSVASATLLIQEALGDESESTCLASSVSLTSEPGDTDTENNAAAVLVGGGNCADLALSGTVLGTPASTTEAAVTATVSVSNNGPDDVASVRVSGVADLGIGATGPTVAIDSVSGCNNAPPTSEDSAYVCEAGSLAAGATLDISVEATVTASSAFDVQYAVVAEGSDDPDPSNNGTSATQSVNLQAPPPPVASGSSSNCFIATAAYGSFLEPEVVTLRQFRDRWLLTNRPGQAFVSWYYRVSPPVADRIATNNLLKALVRAALGPVVLAIKEPGVAFGLVLLVLLRRQRRPFGILSERLPG